MKSNKSIRKQKKVVTPKDNSCMCQIHIQTDKQLKNPIPCIGHGPKCPCIILKAETALKNDVQCGIICGDGSGKKPEIHLKGCSFFIDPEPQQS